MKQLKYIVILLAICVFAAAQTSSLLAQEPVPADFEPTQFEPPEIELPPAYG